MFIWLYCFGSFSLVFVAANDFNNHIDGSEEIINNSLQPHCPDCECGIPRLETNRRIIGGIEARKQYYTWMVLLLVDGAVTCGGSLINDLYVLTAAHCHKYVPMEQAKARVLEHSIISNEEKVQEFNVVEMIVHKEYLSNGNNNDIALFKLGQRVDLSNFGQYFIRPICLPTPGLTYEGFVATAIGWGFTTTFGPTSHFLKEVDIPVRTELECINGVEDKKITKNMMCGGYDNGGTCFGDSGGPLQIKNETSYRYHQIGITSWGIPCAKPNTYSVFTRLTNYLDWIEENTSDACYCRK